MTVAGAETMEITRSERLYFAAVGLLAAWVGFWGYFVPSEVERAIPFAVPPLHARFLGAVYLSGLTIMVGGLLARSWREIRLVPILTALWTGGLCVISLFYLDRFDFATPQPWVWFAAYVIYPLIALGLAWRHRSIEPGVTPETEVPVWARRHLVGQGVVLTALALGLLLAPGVLADVWPWPIDRLLAQIYSAPLLAYGVGSCFSPASARCSRFAPWWPDCSSSRPACCSRRSSIESCSRPAMPRTCCGSACSPSPTR